MKKGTIWSLRLLLLALLAGAVFTGWKFYTEQKPDRISDAYYESLLTGDAFSFLDDSGLPAFGSAAGASDRLFVPPDFERLKKEIPDLTGWIYSPGTRINYPVVQGADNAYYLTHLADKTPNRNGAIFMDWQNQRDCSDVLTALYGHHIRGGRMFSSLEEYRSQTYYEDHPVLYFYTPEKAYQIRLFAGVVTDGAKETLPLEIEGEAVESWLRAITARSDFQAGFVPSPDSRFMALCTCTYDYSNARYVVYGQIEETGQEKEGSQSGETDQMGERSQETGRSQDSGQSGERQTEESE